MRSYNLFRLKEGEDLCCAVPEDRVVPGFVDGQRWRFGGRFEDRAGSPLGFDRKAAHAAVRFNGFYLFQCAGRPFRQEQPQE